MELKRSLAGQFRAGLAMLRECVELCPNDLWSKTLEAPPRNFWRIAYHAAFYTHFYLSPAHDQFTPWPKHVDHAVMTFAEDGEKMPPEGAIYSQTDLLEYIDFISENMDKMLERVDLDGPDSGFPWYPNFPKLDHVLLTLRHLGIHVGQLQELLFERNIDPDWISRR
jgi:hypothetical protein